VRADVSMTLSATSRDEKVARRAFCADSLALAGCASLRLAICRTAVDASRVVCRCLECPQAASGCLKSAATLTNRSDEGASRSALGATSSKPAPRDLGPTRGSGD
jgi:hypothetical protein